MIYKKLVLALFLITTLQSYSQIRYCQIDGIQYRVDQGQGYAYVNENWNANKHDISFQENVTYLGVSYPVIGIDPEAFKNNTGITGSVIINNSIRKIGDGAFFGCTGLDGVLSLGESLENIGDGAFFNCSGLKGDLTIPESVKYIGAGAFRGCSFDGILRFGKSENLLEIGAQAFQDLSDLKIDGKLEFPNSVTTIGGAAFFNCTNLKGELILPKHLITIGTSAFENCSGLYGSLIIPDDVSIIGTSAFENCIGFNGYLALGEKLKTIGRAAFSNCKGFIGDLTIPENVEIVEREAFLRCTGFNGALTFKEGVHCKIEGEAFMDCNNLTSITLRENTVKISIDAFNTRSNYLKYVKCSALTPPECYYNAFKDFDGYDMTQFYIDVPLYVPASSIHLYKNQGEAGWGRFINVNSIPGTEVLPSDVILSDNEITLFVGEKEIISATVTPENTTDKSVTWRSDNEAVAIVGADGTVNAVSVGVATITASCGEASATCKVTVNPVQASSVTISAQDLTLHVGQVDQLTATVTPDNTTDKTVAWKSDNEAVATIGADGTVTAVSVGVATITATCGEASATCKVTVNPITASSVTISAQDLTLLVGQVDQLTATVTPDNTTDKSVTWKSDNEAVATVGTDGTVTAVSIGVATITATCGEASAACKVTVNPITASSVTISAQDLTLLVGQVDQLTATVTPDNTTDKSVTWKSDNEAVATIGADGTVTAVSVGVATITATCGEASATCKVTVNPVPASSVIISTQDLTLLVGQVDQLTATVTPDNTTDKSVTWQSDNESVAIVSEDGTVTAVSVGVATITASCGKASAACKVTVNPVSASSVTISAQDLTLLVGQVDQLTATVTPDNTTDKTVAWKSDNESVATVGTDGTVTAVSIGVANITATCGEVSAICKVTVGARPDTPRQYLKKGNGTSCTFVVLMNLSDEDLNKQGYKFAYGYTDMQGVEHIITVNDLRYCHTGTQIYNDMMNDFWVCAFWKKDDGSIIIGARRYIDGRVDNVESTILKDYLSRSIDINNPDDWIRPTSSGARINLLCADNTILYVHTINGVLVFSKSYDNGMEVNEEISKDDFTANTYIVTVQSGDIMTSKKIIIR